MKILLWTLLLVGAAAVVVYAALVGTGLRILSERREGER